MVYVIRREDKVPRKLSHGLVLKNCFSFNEPDTIFHDNLPCTIYFFMLCEKEDLFQRVSTLCLLFFSQVYQFKKRLFKGILCVK